jgi:hypothetical protein
VPLRVPRLNIPWVGKAPPKKDPYWDFFINTPLADLENSVPEMIRRAPEGNVFPTKADIHTPEITSSHVKEMARYLGADLVGVANLDPKIACSVSAVAVAAEGCSEEVEGYPFAVVCAFRAPYDPRTAPGIGGQVPVQNGRFVTFVLSAWIRELGFRATVRPGLDGEQLAAAAGLGKINSQGRLVTPEFGVKVHVAEVIVTDLPLASDG